MWEGLASLAALGYAGWVAGTECGHARVVVLAAPLLCVAVHRSPALAPGQGGGAARGALWPSALAWVKGYYSGPVSQLLEGTKIDDGMCHARAYVAPPPGLAFS